MCTQFRLSTHVLSNQREVHVKRIIWMYNYRNLSKLIDLDKKYFLTKFFSHCESTYCESTSKHEWSCTCRLDQNQLQTETGTAC